MNIFVLDQSPVMAAHFHNDRHVAKAILETCQLMLMAHALTGSNLPTAGLPLRASSSPAHTLHPWAVWARASYHNYDWLHRLAAALCVEYTGRTGRAHAYVGKVLPALWAIPAALPNAGLTPMPVCMPDEYKRDSVVASYRAYYFGEKRHLAVWYNGTPGNAPAWWQVMEGERSAKVRSADRQAACEGPRDSSGREESEGHQGAAQEAGEQAAQGLRQG